MPVRRLGFSVALAGDGLSDDVAFGQIRIRSMSSRVNWFPHRA